MMARGKPDQRAPDQSSQDRKQDERQHLITQAIFPANGNRHEVPPEGLRTRVHLLFYGKTASRSQIVRKDNAPV